MRTVIRLLPLLTLVGAGCSKSGPELPGYPVSGQVIYDDKPAAGVQVFFLPMSAVLPKEATAHPPGVTGADGRFTIETPGVGDGAPEGGYRVILIWPDESKKDAEEQPDKLFGWYDAKHTKLEAHVKTETNVIPTFKLPAVNGPPPVSEGIPGRN